jgi:hypothetical protein
VPAPFSGGRTSTDVAYEQVSLCTHSWRCFVRKRYLFSNMQLFLLVGQVREIVLDTNRPVMNFVMGELKLAGVGMLARYKTCQLTHAPPPHTHAHASTVKSSTTLF